MYVISTGYGDDIYIYKNQTILFCFRNGKWNLINYESIKKILYDNIGFIDSSFLNSIIVTILDMCLSSKGCCIGLFKKSIFSKFFNENTNEIYNNIIYFSNINDIFWNNSRNMRKQILSIDGATLIDIETGQILSIGTIIPNKGASAQGARTTAAISIAEEYGGIGIKVSDDGFCEIYAPSQSTSADSSPLIYTFLKN